ncbi:MAG: hypothetical protein A2231_02580 [Candidatus Firestonebacteria bacterium RIFOXYA2_FULL_40_8]|nr:MAG: hypothetical protein A2231_02580 [Candidatus Firestonebacteria bacterium RIFOXYA2_FULL_40_8]
MEIDIFTKFDIKMDIMRIEEILSTKIFDIENMHNPFVNSAFIEILILLRDLMAKCEKYSSRISFKDDIIIQSDIYDVTCLIKYVRDALCHIDSDNHLTTSGSKNTLNKGYGKTHIVTIGNIRIMSDYDDETCFCFGEQKIYFKRHIVRAFDEAKQKLFPLIS